MNVTDSKQIVQRIKSKLIHALGTTIGEATNDEIYKAAAECIREDIMTSWADSRRRVQEQWAKKLYYMSAEFLLGRAFSNNLINLGLYETYKAAFLEMGIDFDAITEEEKEAAKKDMEQMLDYIDTLNELDTTGIEPMSHVFPVQNVFREDVVTNGDNKEATLANAPLRKEDSFEVPKTIG